MQVSVEGVLGVNSLLDLLVFLSELLSLTNHALDLFLGEAALVVGDGDLLLLSGSLIFGADVEDTVGVDLEGDLDLGLTTRSRRDSTELKLTQQVVVLGHWALTLEHLDVDSGLVVLVGGEDLGLLGGDDGVTGDELGHDTTDSLNSESERGDIEEEQVLATFTGEDTSLDSGTVSDSLIGVDTTVGLLT